MSIDGDTRLHLIRWKKAFAVGGYILEPDVADHTLAVQWLAIALVVFARLLLIILVSILQQVNDVTLAPLLDTHRFDSSLNYLYVNHPHSPLPVE